MNKITSILGIAIIIAASVSVFLLDDVRWMDASVGIIAGASLIYVKNNDMTKVLSDVINKPK